MRYAQPRTILPQMSGSYNHKLNYFKFLFNINHICLHVNFQIVTKTDPKKEVDKNSISIVNNNNQQKLT